MANTLLSPVGRAAPTRRSVSPSQAPAVESDLGVWLIVASSALVAGLWFGSEPTGTTGVDLLYRGLFVAIVVRAGARAKRNTLIFLTGCGLVFTAPLMLQLVAGAGFIAAIVHDRRPRRSRPLAAAVTAAGLLPLLEQVDASGGPIARLSGGHFDDVTGVSAVIVVMAVAPLVRSAWRRSRRRTRRTLHRVARIFLAATVGATLVAAVAFALAGSDLTDGMRDARAATSRARDGDIRGATTDLANAEAAFRSADRYTSGPWMAPARLVPVVAQHARLGQLSTGHAEELTRTALAVASTLDSGALAADGVLDVDALNRLAPTVDAFSATLERASGEISAARSPWLLPALGARVDDALERSEQPVASASVASDAFDVTTRLVSRSIPTRILLVFTTPSEARGLGGFAGHWVELSLDRGEPTIIAQYRSKDLNDALIERGAQLDTTGDFLVRYGRFDIAQHIQDVTITPDGPTAASTAASLYGQAVGHDVDAVVLLDPSVIDRLLAETGPIDVDGTRLESGRAESLLLVDQYVDYEGREAAREELLAGIAPVLLDRLASEADLLAVGRTLAEATQQDRLIAWLDDDVDVDATFAELGLSAPFVPVDTPVDLLGVVHQNAGQNKIDAFLERRLDIVSTIHDGEVVHDATLTLENLAPATGLPDALIGSNDQGLPPGTNRLTVTWYSSKPIESMWLDGTPIAVEHGTEFGQFTSSVVLALAPNATATIDARFSGALDGRDYELYVPNQPLARAERLTVNVTDIDRGLVGSYDDTHDRDRRIGFEAP